MSNNNNENKPILNIGFWGFWDTDEIILNHYFKNSHRFLYDKYDVRLVKDYNNADVLFCSVFQPDTINFPLPQTVSTKILIVHENIRPNASWFEHFDYVISFAHGLEWNPKHKRIPYWIYRFYEHDAKVRDLQEKSVTDSDFYSRRFCNFIYSNPFSFRREFAHQLSNTYQKVDFGGRLDTNISPEEVSEITPSKLGTEGLIQKRTWMNKYKFSIAFENSSAEGYITEKITDAFVSRTVPLYWGDLRIKKDGFNPKAFLNYSDTPGHDAFVNRIKEVSENKNAYLEMLKQPTFSSVPELLDKAKMLDLYENMITKRS